MLACMHDAIQIDPALSDPDQQLAMTFDKDELEELCGIYLPGKNALQIGQMFGYKNRSSWYSYKNGKRPITTHIIARAITLFPHVPTASYTVTVPVAAFKARR
jgi:hypothetical protein